MAPDMKGFAKLRADEWGVREADEGEVGTEIGEED
jgi:hypothetical protein